MYLEFNNAIFNYSNNTFTETTINNEINKLLLNEESIFYYKHDDMNIKIEIEKDLLNKYNFRCYQHSIQIKEYEYKFIARIEIEKQQDYTNKMVLTECLLADEQAYILYFKGKELYSYIKNIRQNIQDITLYYIIEEKNKNCIDEFNQLNKKQYLDIQNQKFKSVVDKNYNIIEIYKDNVSDIIKDIYHQNIKKSDGFDYGLADQLNYLRIMANCSNINNIRFLNEINKNYFQEVKTNPNPLQYFLEKFHLQPEQDKKLNFVIIPINTEGHINAMLVDLSRNISEVQTKLEDILYSFDSSNCHYQLDIFYNLIKEENKLNKQNLQLTGCCGYWVCCFTEECSKMENIEKIIKECQTGEMQLKVAFKVFEIIDVNKNNKQIIQYSELNLDDENFIKIQIKNTNKYYFLDKDNIYKSCCVNLEFISNLIEEENSNLIISQEDKYFLEEQIIKQLQEMFELKQNRIKELIKIINNEYFNGLDDDNSIETKDKDNSKKKFVENLAKIEYYLKRFFSNLEKQNFFLKKQMDICREHRKENNQELINNYNNNNGIYTGFYNKYSSYYAAFENIKNDVIIIEDKTMVLQKFFEKMQEYYKTFSVIE